MKKITPLRSKNKLDSFIAHIPGSKSYTNRALTIAAHTPGKTTIEGALICDDTKYLAGAIGAFGGLNVSQSGSTFIVERSQEEISSPQEPIFLGGAGTPVRFMMAFSSSAKGKTLVTGNPRLTERPMADLLNAFDTAGIEYTCEGKSGFLPVVVTGGSAKKNNWSVNGEISSQFLSSLLIHASQQHQFEEVTVKATGHLVSRPYVNMTLDLLAKAGISVQEVEQNTFKVLPSPPQLDSYSIEVDASGMSYFLIAAAITQSTVTIDGISLNSAQGDVGLVKVLEKMGCEVHSTNSSITLTGAPLKAIDVDMEVMPDVVLSLAMAAAIAEGTTTITNIANLRVKECDRIAACCNELTKLGVDVEEGSDWIKIKGTSTLNPAKIHTYDDHRVAMAFSLLGLLYEGIEIEDPNCVSKSFPNYWQEFDRFCVFHNQAETVTQ